MWSTINEVLQWVILVILAVGYLKLQANKMDRSRGRDFQPREIRYK